MKETTFSLNLETSYTNLPESFYKPCLPTPVASPDLILWNENLANELGISYSIPDLQSITNLFSGNIIPQGMTPIAQAYAGHQFGNFTMLGDGRAILLGELALPQGGKVDIQLKGSGRTPYSRNGDGRATLSSMLREYLISEAMFNLGIPTTRSLAVTKTGEAVRRELVHEGAILTRIAKSHIRFGTFEYTYHFLDTEELDKLAQYTIDRHFPEIAASENPYLSLFESVMNRQIDLIVDWMRVGFIHGVMNTDNSSVACETIDYGPCAFMNSYDPSTVFSSIDANGRYSFGNQPGIIHWNLACFANTLLPLIDSDESVSIEKARVKLDLFPNRFESRYWKMLGNKIGFSEVDENDKTLISSLLNWMKKAKADYTNTFLQIEYASEDAPAIYQEVEFVEWKQRWSDRIVAKNLDRESVLSLMQKTNPFVIPRNARVESVLQSARLGEMEPFKELVKILASPYARLDKIPFPEEESPESDSIYQTFCGT